MKRLLIITLNDGSTKEIDLLKRGQLPLGAKRDSVQIQELCGMFAAGGFWDEAESLYIAPAMIYKVNPVFSDLELATK
jgi:hypothetical protein